MSTDAAANRTPQDEHRSRFAIGSAVETATLPIAHALELVDKRLECFSILGEELTEGEAEALRETVAGARERLRGEVLDAAYGRALEGE